MAKGKPTNKSGGARHFKVMADLAIDFPLKYLRKFICLAVGLASALDVMVRRPTTARHQIPSTSSATGIVHDSTLSVDTPLPFPS